MNSLFDIEAIKSSQPPMRTNSVDDFMTPPEAILPLLPFIPVGAKVWEPACGTGNLVAAFNRAGRPCVGTDILTGTDFRNAPPVTTQGSSSPTRHSH